MQTSKYLCAILIIAFVTSIAGCGNGVILSGTVTNKAGQPIQGVDIEVKSTTTDTTLSSVVTDEKGYFRVEKLKKDKIRLILEKETVGTSREDYNLTEEKVRKQANYLNIQLDEFSVIKGKVWGEVSDKDTDPKFQPISGVNVDLLLEKSGRWVRTNTTEQTGANGSFTIFSVEKPGNYRLEISGGAYRSIRYPTDGHYLKRGAVWEIEDRQIVLKPGRSNGVKKAEHKLGDNTKQESGGGVLGTPVKKRER